MKQMAKSLALVAAAAGLMAVSVSASALSTADCSACHAVGSTKLGPDWKDVAAAYKDEATLAKTFKAGFSEADRKVLNSDKAKWGSKAGMMTPVFATKIKGHEDEAAKVLFDAVKAGKM